MTDGNWKRCMLKILAIFFCLLNFGLSAQDGLGDDYYVIDAFYMSGAHLIYDCENGRWICTRKKEFERCSLKNTEDIRDQVKNLRCTPFKKFRTLKECYQNQLRLLSMGRSERMICTHPLMLHLNYRF